jgi:bacterioferritin-associated ferredoxin
MAIGAAHTGSGEHADDMVCICMNVTRQQILAHQAEPGATFETLVRDTGVGTKCAACRLNLEMVLGEAVEYQPVQARPMALGLLRIPVDHLNCGFYVMEAGCRTVLRVANPQLADARNCFPVPAYRFRLDVYTQTGKTVACRKARIAQNEAVEIDFSTFFGSAAFGWFAVALDPEQPGFVGNIRPQVALIGKDWAATYHMQLARDASTRRTVMVQALGGKTNTILPIVNTNRRATDVRITLRQIDGNYMFDYRVLCPGFGAIRVALDDVALDLPDNGLILVAVESDLPIRRYFLTGHADGSLSLDHFPNTR